MNQRGLYIGFLPTWGRFWHDSNQGRKPLSNVANAESGSYAMVYAPVGRAFKVRMDTITGAKVKGVVVQPARRQGRFSR